MTEHGFTKAKKLGHGSNDKAGGGGMRRQPDYTLLKERLQQSAHRIEQEDAETRQQPFAVGIAALMLNGGRQQRR
ncbi:MAG: hypothetical protein V8S38_04830 [Lachnospiraceae bacterium]